MVDVYVYMIMGDEKKLLFEYSSPDEKASFPIDAVAITTEGDGEVVFSPQKHKGCN